MHTATRDSMCSTRVSSSNSCVRGKKEAEVSILYVLLYVHNASHKLLLPPSLSLPKISSSYRTLDHLHNHTLTFTVPPSPSQSHPHLHRSLPHLYNPTLTFTVPPSPSQFHPHLHNPTLTFTDNSLAVDPLAAHVAPFLPVERHWLRPLMGDRILWGEGGVRGGGGR